jgi:hypothetical protein
VDFDYEVSWAVSIKNKRFMSLKKNKSEKFWKLVENSPFITAAGLRITRGY